jgi:hypothetical protein
MFPSRSDKSVGQGHIYPTFLLIGYICYWFWKVQGTKAEIQAATRIGFADYGQ